MIHTVEETPNADEFVRDTANWEEGIPRDFLTSSVTPSVMREFYEKHYAQILSFMAEKAHNEKLKDVHSRLTYREDTDQETKSASRDQKRKRRGKKRKKSKKSYELQRENEREYQRREQEDSRDQLLESEDSSGGRDWKRQSNKAQKREGKDLSKSYDEESTTPFT
ncbi:hypothetical protein Tco_0897719 [Tanacetum coccineum]